MDKFFIMNVHNATPKNPKNKPYVFPIFPFWSMREKTPS